MAHLILTVILKNNYQKTTSRELIILGWNNRQIATFLDFKIRLFSKDTRESRNHCNYKD